MLDPESIPKLMGAGTIEVAAMAYMRGSAQPLHSRVLTTEGFRPIGELEVGDLVIGSDGGPTPVIGVHPQGEKKVYRFSAQDGSSTLCSEDHLWTVRNRDDVRRGGPPRVLSAKEMAKSGLGRAHSREYELPLLGNPVTFPEREVPMDPYALGLLLGDGSPAGKATPRLSTEDPERLEYVREASAGVRMRYGYGSGHVLDHDDRPGDVLTTVDPVTAVLRDLGLHGTTPGTEFVPNDYLYNT